MGARSLHVWPQGSDRLGADTLKSVQHPVSRPKASLDAQELLIKGSGGIGGDLCAFYPPPFTVSLDGLVGGLRLPRQEVCKDRKKRRSKSKTRSRQLEERK